MTRDYWPGCLLVGFISGMLAVLLFHQGAVALLHALGTITRPPYSMQPTSPWGVPQIWSTTFWGGGWGVVLAAMLSRWDGAKLVIAAAVLGALLPTLVGWFIVAPLRGQPIGLPASAMIGPIVNGAWGLGTGIGLAILGRKRLRGPSG